MCRYNLTRLLPALLLFVLVAGCDSTDKKPDNLIPTDKMSVILTDIHLAESKVGRLNLRSTDSANVVYKRLERAIFKKHKVDTSAYNKSYIYYSSHPAELEALYERVVEKLRKQSTPAQDTAQKALTVKDSLKIKLK